MYVSPSFCPQSHSLSPAWLAGMAQWAAAAVLESAKKASMMACCVALPAPALAQEAQPFLHSEVYAGMMTSYMLPAARPRPMRLVVERILGPILLKLMCKKGSLTNSGRGSLSWLEC